MTTQEMSRIRRALTVEAIIDTMHDAMCKKRSYKHSLKRISCFCAASDEEMKAGEAIRKLVLKATR